MIRRGQIQLRGRLRWLARRFQTRRRFGAPAVDQLPIVFGNAIPKCGSKLLYNILRGFQKLGPFVDTGLNEIKPYFRGEPTSRSWIRNQLGMLRPGDIRFGYMYASAENIEAMCRPGWVNYLIIRDPRDMVVSEIYYALEINPNHLLHDHFASLEEMESRIDTLIFGIPSGELERVGVREHYERFLDWLNQVNLYVVHFESLVESPREELARILDHLGDNGFQPALDREEAVSRLQEQMAPEKSVTFRKGKTGTWREHFSEANKDHFKHEAGELLVRLGYEHSMDW